MQKLKALGGVPPSGIRTLFVRMNAPQGALPPARDTALYPLGERVARDSAFISRRGTGEGVTSFPWAAQAWTPMYAPRGG
jgi:hypothetical protein